MSDIIETVMWRETDLAWAAGFLDGEGWLGCPRRKPRSKNGFGTNFVTVAASQTVDDPLIKLQGMFGGNLQHLRNAGSVKIDPGYIYRWTLVGSVVEPLTALLPYFVVKRSQALVCLELAERISLYKEYRITQEESEARQAIASKICNTKS